MSMLDPAGHITAALLLRRVEAELGGCRRLLAQIEASVETMLSRGSIAPNDPLHVSEMQSIDLLDQTLADLILCLQELASAPPIGTALPLRVAHITRRLRLADLRERLVGRGTAGERSAEVVLF